MVRSHQVRSGQVGSVFKVHVQISYHERMYWFLCSSKDLHGGPSKLVLVAASAPV